MKRADVVVIGSGPGGSITAALLAEAGRQVILIEEGRPVNPELLRYSYGVGEMRELYRNGGLTPCLGATPIAYVEGRCVGGGSEINSGLYHRTPDDVLEQWRVDQGVLDVSALPDFFAQCERDIHVASHPGPQALASVKLAEGAAAIGATVTDVPLWAKFETGTDGIVRVDKQSMAKTYLPRMIQAGGEIVSGTRVKQLRRMGGKWVVRSVQDRRSLDIECDKVVVCAGAFQTPTLLLRSGVARNIGRSLQLHPMIKVFAQFDTVVNQNWREIGSHQVTNVGEGVTLGCSVGSRPYLAVGLLNYPELVNETATLAPFLGAYYACISPEGHGRVRALPGCDAPVVSYALTPRDVDRLADGLVSLCDVLFAAGATRIFPSVAGSPIITDGESIQQSAARVRAGFAELTAVHAMASCPMGERIETSAVDSFGRVHGVDNLYISDGSILCSSVGVNPQGSIMALAYRNAIQLLGESR